MAGAHRAPDCPRPRSGNASPACLSWQRPPTGPNPTIFYSRELRAFAETGPAARIMTAIEVAATPLARKRRVRPFFLFADQFCSDVSAPPSPRSLVARQTAASGPAEQSSRGLVGTSSLPSRRSAGHPVWGGPTRPGQRKYFRPRGSGWRGARTKPVRASKSLRVQYQTPPLRAQLYFGCRARHSAAKNKKKGEV